MSNEVELKLAVSPDAFPILSEYLNQFNILENDTVALGNTYYDFPDRFLAQQKMGLRVRRQDGQTTLTLKTDGRVVGGLHSRPEYNLPLTQDLPPTPERLRELYPFSELPTAALQAIFTTDFTRSWWLIDFQGTQIEVAFDRGEIVAQQRTMPICEIEFELKKGDISTLLDFVMGLPFNENIYFSGESKAKRGYQLGRKRLVTDWLNKWRDFLQQARQMDTTDNAAAQCANLLKMEQQLIEETLSFPISTFSADFMKTVERVGAFFNLYHYYDENAKLLESALAEKIAQGCQFAPDLLAELVQSNQYLLNEIKELIRFHSETKDNSATIEKLSSLLKGRAYFERMINFMKLNA